MKLRNKKTGQVGNFIINKDHFECVDLEYVPEYRNLAELNEEWEDYEEPKEYWYIECDGEVYSIDRLIGYDSNKLKEIGNYFENKEEAEKAMEKLKTWKRLKDAGCKVVGWEYSDNVDLNGCKFNDDDFIIGLSAGDIDEEDLDLLFGGEE